MNTWTKRRLALTLMLVSAWGIPQAQQRGSDASGSSGRSAAAAADTRYRSAMDGYQSWTRASAPLPWRQANDAMGQLEGHAGHLAPRGTTGASTALPDAHKATGSGSHGGPAARPASPASAR